ncbi:MAG: hypothetical protein ACTSYU_01630, partial [Promethearchaeota archaeon]
MCRCDNWKVISRGNKTVDNKKKINSSKSIGFDTLTDILSGIAFGLILIFALPGLFGVIAAGITAVLA